MDNRIQSYEILEQIGTGGMGNVFRARHIYRNEIVAVKSLNQQYCSDELFRKRFLNEAAALHKLNHPNIVKILDFLEQADGLYLVMEFVQGKSLDKYIAQDSGPIPFKKALSIFYQILAGIGYAHSKGIIHRDIKPGNIILTDNDIVKIADFGVAKMLETTGLTKAGSHVGTLFFMSPEQINGDPIDSRSDIYSLAMTLYVMLAGRMPFDPATTKSDFHVMQTIVNSKIPDPRTIYPNIPEWLVTILFKGMASNKEHRIQSTEAFATLLKQEESSLPEIFATSSLPILQQPPATQFEVPITDLQTEVSIPEETMDEEKKPQENVPEEPIIPPPPPAQDPFQPLPPVSSTSPIDPLPPVSNTSPIQPLPVSTPPPFLPTAPTKKKRGGLIITLIIIFLLLAGAAGAYYYFFMMKPKEQYTTFIEKRSDFVKSKEFENLFTDKKSDEITKKFEQIAIDAGYENLAQAEKAGIDLSSDTEIESKTKEYLALYDKTSRAITDAIRAKNEDAQSEFLAEYLKGMVLVPGGTFTMGNDDGADDEKPAHSVTLDSFYIDAYEVTVAEFREFVDSTKYKTDAEENGWVWFAEADTILKRDGLNWRYDSEGQKIGKEDENLPVVFVSSNDASEYASWKNKRLPAEAEWEFAARGGAESKGTLYSGGDSLDLVGWFTENSESKTHPAGSKDPNELDLYDLSGNVAEWVSDWYSETFYEKSPKENPLGPDDGKFKSYRGGSWYGKMKHASVTYRNGYPPNEAFNFIGFRCVVDIEKTK